MPLSLQISKELIEDASGSISFENVYKDGQIFGSKVQIVMKSAELNNKRIASVQAGTKREILEAIKQQSI